MPTNRILLQNVHTLEDFQLAFWAIESQEHCPNDWLRGGMITFNFPGKSAYLKKTKTGWTVTMQTRKDG